MKYYPWEKIWAAFKFHFQRWLERCFKPESGVLVFHDIFDEESDLVHSDYAISKTSFRSFLIKFKELGYEFVPLGQERTTGRWFSVTMDDGYENAYENGVPILRELQIPYTIFVPTDNISKPGYINEMEIQDIINDELGMIGGHSVSHCELSKCNGTELKDELIQSKKILEEITREPVFYMAYPYGSLNAVNMKTIIQCQRTGYKKAYSTLNVTNKLCRCNYFVPRITVTERNVAEICKRFCKS